MQQTTPEQRAALRQRYGSAPEWLRHEDAPAILAAVADADALAAALAENARLNKAIVQAIAFHQVGRPFAMIGVLRRAVLALEGEGT